MRWWLILLLLGFAQAQDFTGTYQAQGTAVMLVLQQAADGAIQGTLSGNGTSMKVEGFVEDGEAYGYVSDAQGTVGFLAYPKADGLEFYMVELDAEGDPIEGQGQQIIFVKQATSDAAPVAANPLAPASPAANPLASPVASPLRGSFSDGNISLTLQGNSGSYSGSIQAAGQTYPVQAEGDASNLKGSFVAGGTTFLFTASLQDNVLTLLTDGTMYKLERQGQAANPLAGATGTSVASKVVARGQAGELTEDNMLAFIEALEFALAQAGYAQAFSPADKQQLQNAIIQNYPTAKPQEQQAMARMREVWTGVQSHWNELSQDDQGGIILGIFSLAFGEEAVQQYLAQAQGQQGASSSSGCQTIDDCIYQYASPGQISAMNGQSSCWSSSGCVYYDSSSNTQYYEDR